jgi:O-antigen ligase
MTVFELFKSKINKIIPFLIIFSAFAVSLPTAWLSISLSLLLIFWIISGNYALKIKKMYSNPVAMASLFLFGAYLISFFYSSANLHMKTTFLLKYAKLLLIPLVISISPSKKIVNYSLNAFLLGAAVLLIISYFKWLGIFPINMRIHDIADIAQGYTAFKNRIAHNIIMAFALFLSLEKFAASNAAAKWAWLTFAFFAFFNIMYLVNGRTGQLISLCLLLFFIYKQHWLKKFFMSILIILIPTLIFSGRISSLVPERLLHTSEEVKVFSSNNGTSAGGRIEMYKNTIQLALKSPMYGYGVGALKEEYAKYSQERDIVIKNVPNPHNQFILSFFELGALGLVFFFNLFYQMQRVGSIQSLKHIQGPIIALSVTFITGSLFNSLLLDATEGRFFCLFTGLLFSAFVLKKVNLGNAKIPK